MKLLPLARLVRLPNVFTAFADIAVGFAIVHGVTADDSPAREAWPFLLLALASGCLYLSGMVFNDIFDLAEDRRDRPFRPLASGQIPVRTAAVLAAALMLGGIGIAALVGRPSLVVSLILAAAILSYDGVLKSTAVAPVNMGLCRFLNLLFGCTPAWFELPAELMTHAAAVTGIYIVGVTLFARSEEQKRSSKGRLRFAAGLIALSGLLALWLPLQLPAPASGVRPWEVGRILFLYLLAAFTIYLGAVLRRAIVDPTPERVQAAVKRSVLGLILLDALLATVFIGISGLLVALLLLPARIIGKWVYST